ncbi:hypothetical protein Gohar_002672, partial [Gossypium harknessii]|nr:hypothetical protein [Gossypium harknessii]
MNAVAHLLATEGLTKGDQSLMRNGISEYAKEEIWQPGGERASREESSNGRWK